MAAPWSLLAHFEDESILITVSENPLDDLGVSRGRSLVPELLTAAGKVYRLTDGEGLTETFLVHVGDHENLIRVRVMGDRDDETVFVKFGRKCETGLDGFAIIAGSEGDFS